MSIEKRISDLETHSTPAAAGTVKLSDAEAARRLRAYIHTAGPDALAELMDRIARVRV